MKWQQTFSPSSARARDWRLPTMISLAIFLHGIAFYLVQSTAPVATSQPLASASLSILDPKHPSDLTLLRWIENHDPATMAFSGKAPLPPAANVVYRPSYESNLPEPLPVILEQEAVKSMTFFPPGPVPNPSYQSSNTRLPTRALPTRFETSNSLKLNASDGFKQVKMTDTLPLPTQFLIILSPGGNGSFYFLTQTSGDDTLDAYARNFLSESKIIFAADQTSGWVTIHWGSESVETSTP